MATDNKRKLYDALLEDYDMGTYEQFCADLNDEGKRRKLYDSTSQDYDLGTWDSFSQQLGYGQTQQAEAPDPVKPQEPWRPTEQEKITISQQLGQMQAKSSKALADSQERAKNAADYYNNNHSFGMQTVEGKPELNRETGKVEKTYLTPSGDSTTDKAIADNATADYRKALAAADMSVNAQIRKAYAQRDELMKKADKRRQEIDKLNNDLSEKPFLASIMAGGDAATNSALGSSYQNDLLSDATYRQYRAAIEECNQRIKTLENERYKQNGGDVGFWRGFGQTISDPGTWLGGTTGLLNANAKLAANAVPNTESAQSLMQATAENDAVQSMYGDFGFWNRAGVMTAEMLPFMLDFAITGGGFDAVSLGSKLAAKGTTKLIGKEALKEMTELGIKAYANKYGVRGFGRMAENWTIKALGTTADDLLIRAPLMTNTVQAGKTAADIVDRKLGDVVVDENGNYDYSNDKAWGSAIWQGEANAIIENYSEMFGAHLDGVVPELVKTFGGKRISGLLARANSSSYGQILNTTREHFQRLGVSDYFGEVSEEYYGQLWRTMLNLDDAYQQNPDGTRTNLLFTGQFHGDIWGGMALSMGLMGAGKYSISGIAYGSMKHQVNKADKKASEIFTPEKWEPIRELIDNTTNEDMGALAENMVNDQNLSDNERSAVMEYMERSLNLRGLNLGAMAQSRGAQSEGQSVDGELSQSYLDGYEAQSQQEMTDAQNMYEYQRQRAEGMFEPSTLDWFDSDPVNALIDMSRNGLYTPEEIDAALDYINAKTVRDGIIQRVNDDIDEQIAQSDAMINGRINQATGMIQPALMGFDDRQVYVVGGSLAVNPDGSIDRDASDESIVVRDAQTGALEFTDPKSISSVMAEINPELEKANAIDAIRQQAAQAAVDAMNGTLAFNSGDTVQINGEGGSVNATIVGPAMDEESGMPIEGQIVVQLPNGQRTIFTKEQLQAFANAANLERINGFEQERAAARAQQQAVEAEAKRPQFRLNDKFTILDKEGKRIYGVITLQPDDSNGNTIWVDYYDNPNYDGQSFRNDALEPEKLLSQIETYTPAATAETVTKMAESVPKPETEPQQSALSRIPVDEQGQPKYDEADPDTAWDAIVEQAEGDEAIAAEVVADIVADREEDYNAAEKALAKTKEGKPEKRKKDEPAPTMAERIAAKNAAKAALSEAQAIRDKAKIVLDHWKKIAGTKQRREADSQAAEEAEARRVAQEAAEQEARLKAEREEAERKEREALNGVPDWNVDTPADARARGFRRNGPQKVDRPEIIDNYAFGNAVDVKFADDVIPKGNVVVIEASQLQPSHRDGQRNPAHFLDEAQPKERKDAASRHAAVKMAEGMRPEEITSSITAYTGAPSVNSRGEVIQGNNRSEALRIMYERNAQSANKYKQYLIEHAAEFGLTPEAIAAFEQPVLVNMLDVPDEEAITLGQYVAQDTESGGIERIKPKNAVQKMGDKIRTFANLLLRSTDDEDTFAQLVDANGVEVLKWMNQQGIITNTQYASAFDSKGNLSAEAANDLKGIMYQSIFTGGSTRLEEMFNNMPAKAQRAILATAFRDYDSPLAERMISEIQKSIIAFNALMAFEQFRDATNAATAQNAVEAWKKQYAFDDVSGESYLPSETFSNFALALAAMYKCRTQKHIQSVFNMMYDIVQGTEQDNLFEAADNTPKPLAEAIRRVLNLEYKPITKQDNGTNGSTILDVDSEDGQAGRPGSSGNADGTEQSQSEAEPADSGAGTANDSGQGSGIVSQSNLFSYFAGSIKDLIELAKGTATGLFKKIVAPISERLQQDLASYGVEISADYNHVIDNNAIRHALKNHGSKQEEKRGQIPITDADFERIGDVVSNYDHVSVEDGKRNNLNILYSKEYDDGTTIFVEEKRDGRKELAAITMWKKKNSTHTDANHNVTPISDSSEVSDGKGNTLSSEKQDNAEKSSLGDRVKAAEAEVNTEPTEAQKKVGNYKMGHVKIDGLNITIENPKGSVRRGTDANGNAWETKMNNTYGYIRGTTGVDGDKIDVFLSDNPAEGNVYVVDQYNEGTDGTFDEHKVMYGFATADEAKSAYLSNYSADWVKGRKIVVTGVTSEDFKKWLDASDRKTKPFAEYKSVKPLPEAEATDPVQNTEDKKPINPSGNELVSDERYAELRERMRKKLGGQLNMGVDPEILAIGTEMAVYHIEKGARKFKAYASAMITDLGDAIRPYLKAFYNAVRDMPEAEVAGLVADMDSYEDVRKVDIANFDKPATDAMATAAAVVAEQRIEDAIKEAGRLNQRIDEYTQKLADFLSLPEEEITEEAEDLVLQERESLTQDLIEYYRRQGISEDIAEKKSKELISGIQAQTSAVVKRKLLATTEEDILCRPVTDKSTLDRLNNEPTIKVYRAMQMIDGGLRPPMSGKVDGQWRDATEVGVWEEAEEHPEMADEDGKFTLNKGNGKSIKAAYNPYIHTSRSPINDQFSSAWSRPELVTVEVEIPESELTSGYRAEKAHDPVGEKDWKSGPVSRALAKIGQARRVILSRWSRIIRVVPIEEVAEAYAQRLNAHGIEVPFNTVPPALREALAERGVKIGKPEKGNAGKASLPAFERWISEQERERQGDGYGAYSDAEVSYENDPISKVMGKNRFSKKRQAEFAARERKRMAESVSGLAHKLHLDNVEIVTDASSLEGKRAKAKGFYNKRTGKITIIIPNHVSMLDAEQTLLHEAVAHYGLRKLFGAQFDTFLDNVYESADEGIRRKIAEMATKNGWDFRTATEEYLASLAEETNFEEAMNYNGWWARIKRLFIDMLEKIGFEGFRDKAGVVLTDNELRYILWRSYENLVEPGRYRSILGEAADVAKQSELKVGNYAPIASDVALVSESTEQELSNDIFNERLEGLNEKNADSVILMLGRPSRVLLAAGVADMPMKLYGNKVIKKMKKHSFALSELRNLPAAVAHPIAVFNNLGREGNRSILTELKTAQGNFLVTVDVGKGGEDIDFNIISSVFGKGKEKVMLWIEKGYATYIDKEKALNYLHHSAPIAEALSSSRLDSVANIVKSFDNPTLDGEESLLFRGMDGSARAEYDKNVRTKIVDKSKNKKRGTNRAGQLNEAYLDSMRSLKVLQEAVSHESGKPVQDFENAYMAENQMSSRNKIAEEAYSRDFFGPLCKEIANLSKENKEAYKALIDYVIAKHGLERNAYMRKKAIADGIEQSEADSTDYSGLTALTGEQDVAQAEKVTEQMVSDYEASHQTGNLWKRINACTEKTLETRYQGGLLSRDMYELIKGQYNYYIPLKGWEDTTAADIYEYAAGGYGLSSALMRAYGRNSVADDPFATIMVDAQRTIMESNRNIMKQHFLNLAINHGTSLLTISKQWYVQDSEGEWHPDDKLVIPPDADADTVDALVKARVKELLDLQKQGKATTRRKGLKLGIKSKDADTTQHVVKVKRNGETYCIYVNGDPRAARAINGMLNPDTGEKSRLAKAAQEVKNFMSKSFTTWNPEFVVGNLSRDIMFAGVAVAVKEDGSYTKNYTKNIILILAKASLPRLLYKWEHGTLNVKDDIERYFKEFLMNGGETGFTQLNTVEKTKRDMQRFLKEAQGGASRLPRKAWRGFWNGVEFLNRSAEDTTRFAVYLTSRQQGRSVTRSINDAKEITVNFNKKGSGALCARYMNFLYVFFNAAMQAVANAGRIVYRNPGKASVAMGVFLSAGFIMPLISSALAGSGGDGDDDDYWDLPEWIRRNNLVLYIPPIKKHLTLPIAHELRPFYGIGEIAYSVMCGKETAEDGLWKAAEGFTGLFPVDWTGNGGSLKANFSPTIAQPIVQADLNVDYFGKPIYRNTPWNTEDPEWTKAFKGTSGLLVDASRKLSELGSSTDEYGVVDYPKHWYSGDINPAIVEHLLESYTGGLGKTINGVGKTISMLWNEDARELRNVPVLRKFAQSSDERTEKRRFSNEYFRLRDQYEQSKKYLRKLGNLDDEGAEGVADRVNRWLDTEEGKRHMLLDSYFKELNSYQRELNSENGDSIRNLIQQDIDSVRHELVVKIDSINSGLNKQE